MWYNEATNDRGAEKKISKKLFSLLTNSKFCVRMITQKNRGSRWYTAPVERDIKMAVERKSYTVYIYNKNL